MRECLSTAKAIYDRLAAALNAGRIPLKKL
jgi:hypothetical protein